MKKTFFFINIIAIALVVSLNSHAQKRKHVIQHSPGLNTTAQLNLTETTEEITEDSTKANPFEKFHTNFIIQDDKNYKKGMILNPEELKNLDKFLSGCIDKGAFPGCQVFASKNGQVIYKKNFGNFTYNIGDPVTDTTLYDIASVSKILGTTLAVMKLVEQGKIDLNAPLKNYLDNLTGTDKSNLMIKDLLLHQAGLVAWIPFYKKTLDSLTGRPSAEIYRVIAEKDYNTAVAARLYMKNSYKDAIWEEILNSPLSNKGRYVYSDLDFYFLKAVVESISGMSLDQYLNTLFYEPLGLQHTMYNPWKKRLAKKCAPTEADDYFRFQTIQGYVHDQGAAMMGGIEGHAGLFSDVSDMAILMQMLNNGGVYNGIRYFKNETLEQFTAYGSNLSRRGLGFDKPEKAKDDGGPASELCNKSSFGHQGFTGTCAWADPTTGIVFIFLSNRVYPSANNKLINSLDVRTKAQTYIYKALGYGK